MWNPSKILPRCTANQPFNELPNILPETHVTHCKIGRRNLAVFDQFNHDLPTFD